MNKDAIKAASAACKVFQDRVKVLEKSMFTYTSGDFTHTGYGAKEGGALRRSSMELTRALAEMRKP